MKQELDNGTVLRGSANRYTIVKTLGQGSFGITYLAHTQVEGPLGAVDVEVAVKEFFMKDINTREGSSVTGGSSRDGLFDKYRQKFRREAQNLAKMKHPGIVKVIEAFDTNNTTYIAMQYLGGGSLDDLIVRQGRLPEEEALRYIRSIGEALAYMHAHKMLHLDLKPSNVMLDRQGEPVIIDFGLSKHYDESGNPESSTTVGGGTPGYAPLEQASYRDGEGFPVTMDVYALGATLFKMLTGHRPPEADRIFNDGFPSGDLKGVSQTTVDIVAKAMALRKTERYQTVGDFLAALGAPKASTAEATTIENEESELEVAKVVSAPPKPEAKQKSASKPEPNPKPETESAFKLGRKYLWAIAVIVATSIVGFVLIMSNQSDQRWVDLGLPSGTLWKDKNEVGFYDYDQAIEEFGSELPTKEQLEELNEMCTWSWTGDGYMVTGPNGNSIVLPAEGFRNCSGTMSLVGSYGDYWSSTPSSDNGSVAWNFYFHSSNVDMGLDNRCNGYSVRLVKD